MLVEGSVVAALAAFLVVPIMVFGRKKQLEFRGKHVLITGGSTGIGLAMAELLAAGGAHLTLVARSESKLAAARQHLLAKQPEAKVQTISADVTQAESVRPHAWLVCVHCSLLLRHSSCRACTRVPVSIFFWASSCTLPAGAEGHSAGRVISGSRVWPDLQRRVCHSRCGPCASLARVCSICKWATLAMQATLTPHRGCCH